MIFTMNIFWASSSCSSAIAMPQLLAPQIFTFPHPIAWAARQVQHLLLDQRFRMIVIALQIRFQLGLTMFRHAVHVLQAQPLARDHLLAVL